MSITIPYLFLYDTDNLGLVCRFKKLSNLIEPTNFFNGDGENVKNEGMNILSGSYFWLTPLNFFFFTFIL